jgi:tartrate dehydrogenase/decarboxylase/D-malate dehydrogenase
VTNKTYSMAVIPGDGIGNEVVSEGLRVLDATNARFGFTLRYTHYDWSCERYKTVGSMMPDDGITRLRDSDAISLGAASPASRTTSRCGTC